MSLAGIDTNFTLPSRYYTSNEIFEEELERIFYSRWIYVACEADLPDPGDYVALKLGKRSFFLQRTAHGEIKGFYNVCRHRGHELVGTEKGNCRRLICPYHNWTYDLEGNLLHARGMEPGFPNEDFGLNPVEVTVIGGLIYVCLNSPAPPDIEEVRSMLTPYLAPYELHKTKIACQKDIIENCNWKLVIENNRECLHCNSNHPELLVPLYSSGFGKGLDKDHVQADERRFQEALRQKEREWESLDLPYELIEFPHGLWFRTVRLPLANQCISHTLKPEHACKKLLGSFKKPEGSGLSLWTHPNSWNHFLSDHIVTFAVFPLSVDKTLVRTKWLVAAEAVEGVDYEIDSLTYVWTQTNAQDQRLAEGTYRGICSGGYKPGPLADEEYLVKQFLSWYRDQLTETPSR
jgi:Rieske 2Fe-2S family protein